MPGTRRILAQAVEAIAHPFRLEMREVIVEAMPEDPEYTGLILTGGDVSPGELVTYQDSNRDGRFTERVDPKFHLGPVRLSGDAIASARALRGDPAFAPAGEWEVLFTLTPEGSATFAELTRRIIGTQLAIVVDGVVLTAPFVQSEITGGQSVVSGSQDEQEARRLAAALASGPLPVELSPGPIVVARRTASMDWWNPGTIVGSAGLVLVGALAIYRVLLARRTAMARGRPYDTAGTG